VWQGLKKIISCLKKNQENYRILNLNSCIFAIFFGKSIHCMKEIKMMGVVNKVGFKKRLILELPKSLKEKIKILLSFLPAWFERISA